MKVFNVTADFELSEKPDWLDSFRKKFDEPYGYHITLKQATYFDESKQKSLERKIKIICKQFSPIAVNFNYLSFGKTKNGNVIMIRAGKNDKINALQKMLREELDIYGKCIKKYYRGFEIHFKPHLTIARHLTDAKLISAKSELRSDIDSRAIISEVVFNVANGRSGIDFLHPEYTKKYKLQPVVKEN